MPINPKENRPPGPPENGPPSPPVNGELLTLAELVAEADHVRKLLHEASGRLYRLQSALRRHQRHSKAFRAAVASLRQLPLEE